jgi:pimeloyl-ACP methyl ester carboxylesterase
MRPVVVPATAREGRANEPAALAGLAGRGFGETVRRVEEMHSAIAARSFGARGDSAGPVRTIHDGIAAASYGSVRAVGGALGVIGELALRARPPADAGEKLSRSPRGSLALAALNGFLGDRLERERSELRFETELREGGSVVPADRASLAVAYPRASPRLVVFLHGLCETELAWRFGAQRLWGDPESTYGSRLQRELDVTPLYVRYNTGLHVSENGARLARLLDDVVSSWPRDASELALVGHSMGGLVARSACHFGERDGHEWVRATRRVVYLGTPHLGAPLEKVTHLAAAGLQALPETRPVATVLNARSAGIKDLRHGSLLDDDWADCDPDALLGDTCAEVPLLETADHHWVCATVTREPDCPLGRMVGDLLVLFSSASGRGSRRGRRIPFAEENGRHLGGATHFDLLNHPTVDEYLRAWLA